MKLRFLGTGDARQVPVYGCQCKTCYCAGVDITRRRTPCSAVIESGEHKILLDAGHPNLTERFPPDSLNAILLTHYHMDHVAGLFHLRWGLNTAIDVLGPDDKDGCADLYKHPGILNFRPPLVEFVMFSMGSINITPIPLNHSKPCFGYCIEQYGRKLVYLTDTIGLPEASRDFLVDWKPDCVVVDCTHQPQSYGSEAATKLNHNDWTAASKIIEELNPRHSWLTHIGHDMDNWLLENTLPVNVSVARDGDVIEF